MAVYECECALIISTSSSTPQCLRCRRTLSLSHRLTRVDAGVADTVTIAVTGDRRLGSAMARERSVTRQFIGR
jgi:hypothetical protein